jgi:hypothetical protein
MSPSRHPDRVFLKASPVPGFCPHPRRSIVGGIAQQIRLIMKTQTPTSGHCWQLKLFFTAFGLPSGEICQGAPTVPALQGIA